MLNRYPQSTLFIFIALLWFSGLNEVWSAPIIRDVFVFSECEKMASIRVRNGVAPYNYVWSYEGNIIQTDSGLGESDMSTIEQAQGGDYVLTVTDSDGNTYTETINFSGSTNFILNILYEENQECEGETFGQVYGTIENGIAPFTINFFDESNALVLTTLLNGRNLDLNGVPAGSYLVEVIDATGCKELTNVEIEEVEPLVLAPASGAGTFPETCEDNGGATFDAADFSGDVSFRIRRANGTYVTGWLPAPGGQIRYDQLEAGDYVLEVTDDYRLEDCPEELVFNIANEQLLDITLASSPVSCFGDADGVIHLEAERLFMGFAFPPDEITVDVIDPSNNVVVNGQVVAIGAFSGAADFPGLSAGMHTVVVRHGGVDYPACTISYPINIDSPSTALTASVSSTPEVCFGAADGTATVSRSGGWGGYTYQWSNGQTSRTATGLSPGDYTVRVTDSGGCFIDLTVRVDGPSAAISADMNLLSGLTCVGANDGSARISDIQGGWGNYSIEWSNGETGPEANQLPAGTNTVTVRDEEGCERTFSIEVPVPDAPDVTYTPTAPGCFGAADGSIRVQIHDTSTTYTVSVNGVLQSGSDLLFENLTAGQHEVQIAYSAVCNITTFVDIDSPDELRIGENSLTIAPVSCTGAENGSISGLTASGGTGSLSFQWEKEISGTFQELPGESGLSLNNISGGTYRLNVRDVNGCSIFRDYVIDEPDPLQVGDPVITDVTCFGNADGAVSFSISGGTAPYTYALNGGASQSTSDSPVVLTGLAAANDNFIVITDANGCTVPNINFDVLAPPAIAIGNIDIQPETCFGQGNGGILLDVEGGSGNFSFEWTALSDPSTVISNGKDLVNRAPGQYVLKVTDLNHNSCVLQEDFVIPATPELELSLDGAPVDVLCYGESTGAIAIAVEGGTGGYTFAWEGPNGFTSDEQNPSALPAGLYQVRVTDENGCWEELSDILIKEPSSAVSVNLLNRVSPKCHDSEDGRIEIQAGGGMPSYQINWEKEVSPGVFVAIPGSSLTLTGIGSGTYRAQVRDANSCIASLEVDLDGPDPLQVSLTDKRDVSCFGRNDGQISLEVTGGSGVYFFDWDHGFINQNPTNLGEGTYGVTVRDANGCSFRLDNIEIDQPEALQIDVDEVIAPSCGLDDGSVSVSFTGGDPLAASNIWVELATETVVAIDQEEVTGLRPGFYRIEYSTGANCVVTTTVHVPGPGSPLQLVTNSQDAVCPGENGIIFLSASGGVPGYTYYVMSGGIWVAATGTILAGLPAGDYDVRVDDASGCQDFDVISIAEPNPPVIDAEVTAAVSCFGADDGAIAYSVSGGTGSYTLQWYRKTALGGKSPIAESDLSSLIAGTYFMEIVYAGGCTLTSPEYEVISPEPLIFNTDVDQPLCFTEKGVFSITFSGGNPGKTLTLTGDNGYLSSHADEVSGTYIFENLEPGNYTWQVQDVSCPVAAGDFSINDPVQPSFSISHQDVSCFGAADGILQITDPVVQAGRSFSVWINGVSQGSQLSFFNLSPGFYQVSVQDNRGCQSGPQLVEITSPEGPLSIAQLDVSPAVCHGDNSGSVSFQIAGGRPNYRALLSPDTGSSTALTSLDSGQVYAFTNLVAGNYKLEIWDENDNCLVTETISISEPEPLTADLEAGQILCAGGTTFLDLSVAGGTLPHTFTWERFDLTTATWEILPENTNNISGLSAGEYRYSVTDASSCVVLSEEVTLADAHVIDLDFTAKEILCYGGSALVSLSASSPGRDSFTFFVNGSQIFGDNFLAQSGTYAVYARDNINGCVSEEAFITLDQPSAPLAVKDFSWQDLSCYGASDGSISLVLEGGTAPYTISLNGNTYMAAEDEELLIDGLEADISYDIDVLDANGCALDIPSKTLQQPLPLQAAITADEIRCFGETTTIDLQITGGLKPYHISWSFSPDGSDFVPLTAFEDETLLLDVAPGFYRYAIGDGACGDQTDTVLIEAPVPVVLEAISQDVSCFGGSDGRVEFRPSGGTGAGYRIFFNGLEVNEPSIGGLTAGTYTAFAMNGSCRSEDISVTVNQPDAPLLGMVDYPEELACHGDLASVGLSLSGGTAPYRVNFNGEERTLAAAGELSFDGVGAGSYTIELVDDAGCSWQEHIIITEPEPLSLFTENALDVSCFSADDGSLSVQASGGSGSFTYTWLDAAGLELGTGRHISGLAAGEYRVEVRDENGCLLAEDYVLTEPEPVDFTYQVQHVTCVGAQNGQLTATGSGGRGEYRLVINGIQYPGMQVNGLIAGIYQVMVMDANGCTSETQEVIVENPLPLALDAEIQQVSCYAANDGSVKLLVDGGTAPYRYRWSDGNTLSERTGMAPGNYEVIITDNNGCTLREQVLILQPEALLVQAAIQDVTCFGGSDGEIRLDISGGSGGYTVRWESISGGLTLAGGLSLEGLQAGRYRAVIQDENACTILREYEISEPASALSVVPLVTDVRCAGEEGGAINLVVAGGTAPYRFNWSSGETTSAVSNKTGGVYQVQVMDANGCVWTDSIRIDEPEPVGVSAEISDVSCKMGSDGAIALTITGGTGVPRIQWSNGMTGTSIAGLRAGTYTAFVLDEQSCFGSYTYQVGEPEEVLTVTGVGSFELCFAEDVPSLNLEVSGGTAPYSYAWSHGATDKDLVDIAPGNYEVTVTDAKGCTLVQSFEVPVPGSPMDLSVSGTLGVCSVNERGSAEVTVQGGIAPYSFLWSNGATTSSIDNLNPGSYSVEVTDARGCVVREEVAIIRSRDLRISLEDIQAVSCFGAGDGSISISVMPDESPFSISWSNGIENQQTITGLGPGVYTATVTDEAGCTTSVAYQIREPEILNVYETITDVNCFGNDNGIVFLEVRGGTAPYTYAWSNGATSKDIRNLAPGTYSVRITDRMGCATGGTYTVAEPDPLQVVVSQTGMLACHGDANGFINLEISGGVQPYSITWSDAPDLGTQNRNGLEAGSYTVMVTDDNNCTQINTIVIEEPAPLQVELFTRFDVDCENKVLTGEAWIEIRGGTGEDYEIDWNTGDQNVLETQFFEDGLVEVRVTDESGCSIEVGEVVSMPLAFTEAEFLYTVLSTGVEGEILVNDPVQFRDQTLGNVFTWEWDFGDGNKSNEQHPIHSYSRPGIYTISLTTFDVLGCVSETSRTVEVVASYRILIPNAFSPNEDGLNDRFKPKLRGITDFEMHIFNKWGELVYSSFSQEDSGWDGKLRGRLSPNGNYVYKINYVSVDGEAGTRTGVFTLIY
ncbi:gliding motility-associated C-terminal domain-containing protein [Cyclobacterium lianum]|uniref:Gliding motility-associated C-terminal domain-containing protein n=1 Tax=Cyclobacterium lianum TaxID=388280 RepID=A0A1M7PJ48_9BACT|nr:gliding motility-associated C-terminal domain-containing protein [Cyclobacterium lianum]SHN17203.1 gliding motility-associated C-terminal domain-containing protein [Cyclobacterium lianum]